MDLNYETLAVALIVLVPLVFIINAVIKKTPARQILKQIRPIIIESLYEIVELSQAKAKGQKELEDLVVDLVHEHIEESKALTPEEMELVTKDLIRQVVIPLMAKLNKPEKKEVKEVKENKEK